MAKRFEVLTNTLCDGWVNCWSADGQPSTFATEAEAYAEIDELISDYHDDIVRGERDADDYFEADDFRVVEVKPPATRSELTPQGEQLLIAGCERILPRTPSKATQMALWD